MEGWTPFSHATYPLQICSNHQLTLLALMTCCLINLQALNPDAVLAVSFLGCWYLREAVTPMDILRWASDGRLPVLSLPPLSAKLLQSAQAADCTLPPALLHPTGALHLDSS